jgi:hypothetical protein
MQQDNDEVIVFLLDIDEESQHKQAGTLKQAAKTTAQNAKKPRGQRIYRPTPRGTYQ